MEYIRVTKDNLEKEHICCAISNNKDVQVSSKKAWLTDRFNEGLVFLKSVERGKCFIEYIPAENAWVPIEAEGYMYIDCLWVSGSFKGHGYSTDLLTACIEDSKGKGKKGLCILCAAKKKPFLADPKFLKYKGFAVADEADNGIQLWYLPVEGKTDTPRFKDCGFVLVLRKLVVDVLILDGLGVARIGHTADTVRPHTLIRDAVLRRFFFLIRPVRPCDGGLDLFSFGAGQFLFYGQFDTPPGLIGFAAPGRHRNCWSYRVAASVFGNTRDRYCG